MSTLAVSPSRQKVSTSQPPRTEAAKMKYGKRMVRPSDELISLIITCCKGSPERRYEPRAQRRDGFNLRVGLEPFDHDFVLLLQGNILRQAGTDAFDRIFREGILGRQEIADAASGGDRRIPRALFEQVIAVGQGLRCWRSEQCDDEKGNQESFQHGDWRG